MKPIKNSYFTTVSIPATGAGTKAFFQYDPILENKKFIGLEVVSASQLSVAPDNSTMIVEADVPKFTLVLQDMRSTDKVYQTPLNTFYPAANGGIIRSLDDIDVNITKSYIQIVDSTGLAAGESVGFNFYFE